MRPSLSHSCNNVNQARGDYDQTRSNGELSLKEETLRHSVTGRLPLSDTAKRWRQERERKGWAKRTVDETRSDTQGTFEGNAERTARINSQFRGRGQQRRPDLTLILP